MMQKDDHEDSLIAAFEAMSPSISRMTKTTQQHFSRVFLLRLLGTEDAPLTNTKVSIC